MKIKMLFGNTFSVLFFQSEPLSDFSSRLNYSKHGDHGPGVKWRSWKIHTACLFMKIEHFPHV